MPYSIKILVRYAGTLGQPTHTYHKSAVTGEFVCFIIV